MNYSKIIATGAYVPEKIVSNDDLSKIVETNHEWIVSRTGIEQRHIVGEGEFSSHMAIEAAKRAITKAAIDKNEIDLIIVGTTTPDAIFPSTAAKIQSGLEITGSPAAFDVQAVCSGFVFSLAIADSMMRSGSYKTALVIGVDAMSKIVDWQDRGTCVLFGDGAGAAILKLSNTPGIIDNILHTEGNLGSILYTNENDHVVMNGREVYKHAVQKMTDTVLQLLERNNLSINDLDFLVPHQANIRIIEAVGERLGLSPEKTIITVSKHANTSAGTIPLALDAAITAGKIKQGDLVATVAVGGGLTWGGNLFRL